VAFTQNFVTPVAENLFEIRQAVFLDRFVDHRVVLSLENLLSDSRNSAARTQDYGAVSLPLDYAVKVGEAEPQRVSV
jgi:hypothetical protein